MEGTPDVSIYLTANRKYPELRTTTKIPQLYGPGDFVCPEEGFMRGHGTYTEDGSLKASVAGPKEVVNKLITVKAFKNKYEGAIGDVVVGRIVEVQQKRWKVDTNSRLDSILLLSSVNLPGGELRRRSAEDEQMMRKYLREGDLISAEVQQIYNDGSLVLHGRTLKYGKLSQGTLVEIPAYLIKRVKTHFYNLPCGVSVILGKNGYIWLSPPVNFEENTGGFVQNFECVSRDIREAIARLRNCIMALAAHKIMIHDTTMQYAYEESIKYSLVELLKPDPMYDVAIMTVQREKMMENA